MDTPDRHYDDIQKAPIVPRSPFEPTPDRVRSFLRVKLKAPDDAQKREDTRKRGRGLSTVNYQQDQTTGVIRRKRPKKPTKKERRRIAIASERAFAEQHARLVKQATDASRQAEGDLDHAGHESEQPGVGEVHPETSTGGVAGHGEAVPQEELGEAVSHTT